VCGNRRFWTIHHRAGAAVNQLQIVAVGLLRTLEVTIAALLALTHTAAASEIVWLEAEHFARLGGWTSDTQFIDQMGSPYLMAMGQGKPVADASTEVTLPRAGRWRLWVRTKDWVPEHHPGRFQVVAAGRAVEHVFGASGQPGWRWEDGGTLDLPARCEFRLHDLVGEYGRCDAIVLCDDLQWTPPAERKAIDRLRAERGGVSRQVDVMSEHDVVVIGGGLAGCMAAVTAARLGVRTVLIQDRPVLGGNASVEILVPPVGAWPHPNIGPLDPRETGLVEEIRTPGRQTIDEAKVYSGRLARLVRGEPGLDVYMNVHATGVTMKGKTTIAAVDAVDVLRGRRMRFPGRMFIDCTGDAVIGVAAGAEYRTGREPRSMHNESLAPEQGNPHTMGNSLKYVTVPTGKPQAFTAPAWAMKFPTCASFPPDRHPRLSREIGWQWIIELGGTRDTYADAEEIRDELLRLIYGLWDHVKNHCPELGAQAADHRLAWVSYVVGKRENRRLIGDYVLNENDVAQQTLPADRVAYSAWCLDDHYSEGFFYNGPPSRCPYRGMPHSVPYRALYSKNIDNLLMAGRNISATHLALSATRVQLTNAVIGQATGTAAAMCVEHETTPRGVYQNYLEDLQQQLLKDGATIIELPNRDPRDLARSATATASSEKVRSEGERMAAAKVIDGFARVTGTRTCAWAPDPKQRLPQWVELAWDKPQTFNTVHVSFLTKNNAPQRFAVEVFQGGAWRRVAEVADNRHRRHVLPFEPVTASKVRLVILAAKPYEQGVCEIRVYDDPPRLAEIARRAAALRDLPDDPPQLAWDDSLTWVTGVDPKKLTGMVVDDTQAETIGDWSHSDHTRPYVGSGYAHDANAAKGSKSIVFRPKLPAAGWYEIRLAYSGLANRATNVPVTIATADGPKTVRVDQSRKPPYGGLSMSLGRFRLAPATAAVTVSNEGTKNFVTADAVQFIPAETPPGK
jgi:hypothetical protein